MPSLLMSNQSGGQPLWSGNPYSGHIIPVGGIQLVLDNMASGNAYVALSGKMTVNSGGFSAASFSDGSGMMDGIPIFPGGTYYIPRLGCGTSGTMGVTNNSGYTGPRVMCDPEASGKRLWWEVY